MLKQSSSTKKVLAVLLVVFFVLCLIGVSAGSRTSINNYGLDSGGGHSDASYIPNYNTTSPLSPNDSYTNSPISNSNIITGSNIHIYTVSIPNHGLDP